MRKANGIVLVLIGLLLFFVSFPFAMQYSLLLAMVASLPAFFIIFFGCSLILGSGFKRAFEQCVLFTVAIMLPWVFLLPLSYQIISSVLLVTVFVSVLLWYRRKLLPHHEREKTGKDPT
jgi:hypothetical protein